MDIDDNSGDDVGYLLDVLPIHRESHLKKNLYAPLSIAVGMMLALTACSAGSPPTAPAESPTTENRTPISDRVSDGILKIGYILPETGSLAGLGTGIIAGVKLAISDIAAYNGANKPVIELVGGDEAGDPTIAGQTADRLLSQDVDAVIGPVSSAISLSVIDKITGSGVMQCAGANTSATFSTYDSNGLYFRSIAPNIKQGPVLADAVIGEGASRVAVMVRNDDYGESLRSAVVKNLEAEGAEIVAVETFDPAATTFSAEVAKVKKAAPDAVVVIAFQEGASIIRALIETGLGPDSVKLFGTDGMSLGALAKTVNEAAPDVLEGMQATQSSSQNDPTFIQRLLDANPGLMVTNFAPYHYDCAISIALASMYAKSDATPEIAKAMYKITNGPGTACTSFAECADLIAAGKEINYEGVSGPMDLNAAGEPSVGLFDVVRFDSAGVPQIITTVRSED